MLGERPSGRIERGKALGNGEKGGRQQEMRRRRKASGSGESTRNKTREGEES
jgi:hypothetical protein